MVGSSKILTVSYGTFSCTLEGFDDSFSTMKAIAEYFRDLAADDRYFGAEPPTPDAEMLARIAEREVARRVEARMSDNGIHLKAGPALAAVGLAGDPVADDRDGDTAVEAEEQATSNEAAAAEETIAAEAPVAEEDAAEAQDPAPEVVEEPAAVAPVMPPVAQAPVQPQPFAPSPLMSDDSFEDEDEPQDMATTAYAPVEDDTPAHLDIDSVAAKLQRIRAVVGRGNAATPLDGSDRPNSLFAEAQDDPASAIEDAADEEDFAEDIEDAGETAYEDNSADLMADDDAAEEGAEDGVETLDVEEDAPVLGAASLDILSSAMAAELDTSDDEDSAEEAEVTDEADEDVYEEDAFEAIVDEDDSDEDVAVEAFAEEDAAEDDADASDAEETTAETETDVEVDDSPAPVRARVIRMRRSAVDAALAAGTLQDESDDDATELHEQIAQAQAFDSYVAPEETEELDDLGASAEAETEAEDSEELARLDGVAEDDLPPSSLSPDAEAELQAELAALVGGIETEEDALVTEDTLNIGDEDELSDDMASLAEEDLSEDLEGLSEAEDQVAEALDFADEADEDDSYGAEVAEDDSFESEVAEDAAAEAEPEEDRAMPLRPRRVTLPGGIDESDASMDRILSQTEAQMSAPDSSRRRESLEQLKAAVAATEADREMSDGADAAVYDTEETFRDDLRQAVRPTRPIRPQRPTERGERTERPTVAPLKLVASQRVDLPAGEDAAEDAPRRPVMPVRPRRVMKVEEAADAAPATSGSSSRGFAAFAEEMGAHELSDLLEAAAAYTAFVEGSVDFSRPQLMNKIKETSDREYSREEGLRSFGTLLRQGRIMKVRNGRFQVSGETRFNPERRAG